MKVNMTLLTMITFTARAIPLPPEALLEPAASGMERILGLHANPKRQRGASPGFALAWPGPKAGSSSRRGDGCALSMRSRDRLIWSRPTRLADGLGLESAPIHCAADLSP